MRIDAHQHFWQVARGDYGWLNARDVPSIYRDFLPNDLAPLLRDARIDRTIVVQAAPTVAETEFLLGLAERTLFIAGVVGWVDFEAATASGTIAHLSRNSRLRGLRPMIQDMADDAWMLKPSIMPALDAMKKSGLRFDALVKPRHLGVLERFLDLHGDLAVVIDHGAKPNIGQGEHASWAEALRRIARAGKAFCKLSGLATEAGANWSTKTLRAYVDTLLECFGPNRLMWGSDWPVLNLAGDYPSWVTAAEALTAHLSNADRDLIFGGTAARFYGVAQ